MSFQKRDHVYHFRQNPNGACTADAAHCPRHRSAVLDSLGMNGGALLQSNCVISVEGPSDRLYVREWLRRYCDEKGTGRVNLQEHADFTFAFYGGGILSHFDFEPQAEGRRQRRVGRWKRKMRSRKPRRRSFQCSC